MHKTLRGTLNEMKTQYYLDTMFLQYYALWELFTHSKYYKVESTKPLQVNLSILAY